MRPPCEIMVQKILPAIRAELARTMIQEYGMPQQDIALRLGVSKAAVSQYASLKRGADTEFSDEIRDDLKRFAHNVASVADTTQLIGDFCNICKNIQSSGWLCKEHLESSGFIHEDCTHCLKAGIEKQV